MERKTKVAKAVKVIAFWTGARRGEQAQGPEASLRKLKYTVEELERKIDYGCPMDLIIVNSVNIYEDDQLPIDYLNSLNGKETRNGKIIVLHKENRGLSFGAFSYAFDLFKNYYDYWFFSEDDYLTAKDGVMSTSIRMMEADPGLGFVATVEKVGRGIGAYYARGGSGISSTSILKRAWPDGLPFYPHEFHMRFHEKTERQFTREITDNLGLKMDIALPFSLMVWGMTTDSAGPTRAGAAGTRGGRRVYMDSYRVNSVASPNI